MKASIIIGALIIAAAIIWSSNSGPTEVCVRGYAEYSEDGTRYAPLSCE